MKYFKRTSLAFGLLVVLTNTSHASPLRCGWQLEFEPFYAKATDTLLTNSIYAVKIPDPVISGDFKEQYHLNLDTALGGRVAVGYDFAGCLNSTYGLSLEYTFFNHDNSATVNNDSRNHVGLPVIAPAEFIDITDESSARFSHATSNLDHRYNTFDLLATKNILTRNCAQIKFFAGLRYFHLREQLDNNYKFFGDIESVHVRNVYHVNFKNELDNIGPRIGANVFYPVVNGFGITGQIAGSLLYGTSQSEFYNTYNLSPASLLGDPTNLSSSNHLQDSAHVVPGLSGKIGLAYKAYFCNCSSFEVEVGYRGDKYFNAINDTAYQQLLAGDDVNSNSNYHDFNLSGVYLNVTFHA